MIFRYPGGKSKKSIVEKILSKAPNTYREYREAFVGGGGIFFNIPLDKSRWINDKDEHLMQVYLALRDRPQEFIERCRQIEPEKPDEELAAAREDSDHKKASKKALYNARLKKVYDSLVQNKDCDQALRYFFVNRTNWMGRVNYEIKSRCYFSHPSGWNIVKGNALENASKHLQGVKITTGSYEELLSTPGDDVWIYLDPPYKLNTDFSKTSQLYKHNFTKEDHENLAKFVKNSSHKILLSYDDDEFVRNLYNEFNLHSEEWTYCGRSSADDQGIQAKTKQKGKELIITNY